MASEIEAGTDFIKSWLPSAHFKDAPGGIVAISVNGETVLNQAYGTANVELNEGMTTDHQFQIASQSKLFTATAIMQLQEKGLLDVSDVASLYIPELKNAADPRVSSITIEQLLTHTAGLVRDGRQVGFWEGESRFPSDEEVINTLASDVLVFPPANQMKYSNLGYAALGAIIERVSDTSYDQYISDSIISPLELTGTSVGLPIKLSNVPKAYGGKTDSGRADLPLAYTDAFTPATGIYSTTGDLQRFFNQLAPDANVNSVLSEASIKAMTTPRVKALYSGGVEYGLGVDIGVDEGVTIIGHGGGFPGHKSGTIIDTAHGITVSAFANGIDIDAFSASIDTARVLRYFMRQGEVPDAHREYYNTTLESIWRKRQLVSVGNKVLSIYPGAYNPFNDSSAETLTPVNNDRLVITQSNSFDSAGEEVTFPADDKDYVVYAGRRLKKIPQ